MNAAPAKPDTTVANILIVDDTPINLQLLSAMLTQRGFRPRPVTSGKAALAAAEAEKPDLILMDVSMPEMNGYEACERIKSRPSLREVPILFLSALSQTEDKIRGFRAGGVDYITKPFLIEEIDARINAHLRSLQYQRDLQVQNSRLESAVNERTRDLNEAYKALQKMDQMKREFFLMLSHEMRTPSNGILGISELILDLCPDTTEVHELRTSYMMSRDRLKRLLDDSQYLIALDEKAKGEELKTVEARWLISELCTKYKATVEGDLPSLGARIPTSGAELEKLLLHAGNLAQAFGYLKQSPLTVRMEKNSMELSFELPSLRLNQAQCDAFFNLGSSVRTMSQAECLGLAPIIAKRLAELCGGTLTLSSLEENTGALLITLPIC